MMWWKYKAFTNGISPAEFNRSNIRDWKEIMAIESAMTDKEVRIAEVNKLMGSMK